MAIPIQCRNCGMAYKVDDKLVGKKVRCKDCGAIIAVDQPPDLGIPDVLGLESTASAPSPAEGEVPGPRASRICGTCKAPIPSQSRICLKCGQVVRTDAPAGPQADSAIFIDGKAPKRHWRRAPGSPALESLDQGLKLGITILLVAGIIVWIVHIARSPAGISVRAFMPLVLLVLLSVGGLAPLLSYAVRETLKGFKILPRDDTYLRILTALLLPLAISLFSGLPGVEFIIKPLTVGAWAALPLLWVYYFRGDWMEVFASFGAAFCGLLLGLVLLGFAAKPANALLGPLYSDMLPTGPWQHLAFDRSPEPHLPRDRVPSTSQSPMVAATTVAPVPVATTPAVANPPTTQLATTQPAPQPQTTNAPTPTTGPAVVQPLPVGSSPDFPVARLLESPFLSNPIAGEPGLKEVTDILASPAQAPYFLAVRDGQSNATVERWSLNPLAKAGEMTFSLFPRKANGYALNPRGDLLAALIYFPRTQLDVANFENRPPRRTIPLDEPRANPTLVGFLDISRVCLRWDLSEPDAGVEPRTRFQIWNATTGQVVRIIPPADTLTVDPHPNAVAASPDGRFLAVLSRDRQLLLFNTETGLLANRILPAGNLGFTLVSMAFAPDSARIALYAIVADVPTIMAFRVNTGEAASSSILKSPVPRALLASAEDAPTSPNRALLWLADSQHWLVNGNEIIDVAQGRSIGTLGAPGGVAVDARLAGPDTLILLDPQAGGRNALIARINREEIRTASQALR